MHQCECQRGLKNHCKEILDMPIKRSPIDEQWLRTPPPQTPLQKRAYLDTCTKSIVSEPQSDTEVSFFDNMRRSALPAMSDTACSMYQNTFTGAETLYINNRMCIVCDSIHDVHITLANPFAIRCYVGICKACHASK